MLWWLIGALVGLIYYKPKYNLNFWGAISSGIVLMFTVYFGFGFIMAIITTFTGLEPVNPNLFYAMIYAGFVAIGILYLRKLAEKHQFSYSSKATNQFIDADSEYATDSAPNNIINTSLAGVTFEGRQKLLQQLRNGQAVRIVREPSNPYDINAIKVEFSPHDSRVIGYINKKLASEIAWIFDDYEEESVIGYVDSVYRLRNDESILGVKISFQLPEDPSFDDEYSIQEPPDFEDEDDYWDRINATDNLNDEYDS